MFKKQRRSNMYTDAADILAGSIKDHNETLEHISQNEIASKDRVDISLSEYIRMKTEIEKLNGRLAKTNLLIMRMGIPAEVIENIDPESVHVETCDDHRWFKKHYRIGFSVDTSGWI